MLQLYARRWRMSLYFARFIRSIRMPERCRSLCRAGVGWSKMPDSTRRRRRVSNASQFGTANARSASSVARASAIPCAYETSTSRAAAPTSSRSTPGAASRRSTTSAASQRKPCSSAKSSKNFPLQLLCRLEGARVTYRYQIGVNENCRSDPGHIVFECPEASQELDIACRVCL